MPFVPTGYPEGKPDFGQVLGPNLQHSHLPPPDLNWHGGAEPLADFASRKKIGSYVTANVPSVVTRPEGRATDFPGGADYSIDLGPKVYLQTGRPFTLAIQYECHVAAGASQIGHLKSNGTDLQLLAADGVGQYEDFAFGSSTNSDWGAWRSGAGTAPANQVNSVVIQYDGNDPITGDPYDFHINGAYVNPVGSSAYASATSRNQLGVTTSFYFNGLVWGIRLWGSQRLANDAAKELSGNFWRPFGQHLEEMPYPREFFFLEAAGDTLIADSGSYTYTGHDATLIPPSGTEMTADSGSYAYTGHDAGLLINRYMTADAGSYAYTGFDVNFSTAKGITADSGSYAYTGHDVTLTAPNKIMAEGGAYGYTGYDVTLTSTAQKRWKDLTGDPAGPWVDL